MEYWTPEFLRQQIILNWVLAGTVVLVTLVALAVVIKHFFFQDKGRKNAR